MGIKIITLSIIIAILSSVSVGLYLVQDYYMDDDWNKDFGMVCGQEVQDDCALVNSHLNTFGLYDYDSNIDCTMTLDAGAMSGALYKLEWRRFKLQGDGCFGDYLEIYDADMSAINRSNLIGRFCGRTYPNTTGYPTQRYITLKFHTDGSSEDKGFRLMATRTLPYPCASDEFHCRAENRCIDERLKCDGIVQCDDGIDENDCSFWEKLIGGFLALGLAGIVGITGAILFFCTSVGIVICACTCCKKPCCAVCNGIRNLYKRCRMKTSKTFQRTRNKVSTLMPDRKSNLSNTTDGCAEVETEEKISAKKLKASTGDIKLVDRVDSAVPRKDPTSGHITPAPSSVHDVSSTTRVVGLGSTSDVNGFTNVTVD